MRMKKLSRLPFTTPHQKEAQNIIKNLWKDSEIPLTDFAKSWINQSIREEDKDYAIVLLYHTIKDNEGEIKYLLDEKRIYEKDIHLEVINFNKYNYENKNFLVHPNKKGLNGRSILSILDMLKPYYDRVVKLHKYIIEIYNSNLEVNTKKYLIMKIVDDEENFLNRNSFELNFTYPVEIIESLNEVYVLEEDNFIIQLALEAYQDITHYYLWITKHKIEEKRFRERKTVINNQHKELIEYLNIQDSCEYDKLPNSPQDIIHDLLCEYYGEHPKGKLDDGIQKIIDTINPYKRMPKRSKYQKNSQFYDNLMFMVLIFMQDCGATMEEEIDYIENANIKQEMLQKILPSIKANIENELPNISNIKNRDITDKDVENAIRMKYLSH